MFGKRLRELREARNLSMDKMIELYNEKYNAKMNKSTLSRYENGLQNPIYTVVKNLANFFDVPVDYLSGSNDSNKKTFSVDEMFKLLNNESDIKERLKNRRKELKLTMLDIANYVGVSEATISRWESGEIEKLPSTALKSLAKILRTTPEYIMGWEKDAEKEQHENEPPLTEKQKFAFRLLLRVANEKNLDRLIDFLQLLIQAENQ